MTHTRRGFFAVLRHPLRTLEGKMPTTWRLHYGIIHGLRISNEAMKIHIRTHDRDAQNGWMNDNLLEAHRRHPEAN